MRRGAAEEQKAQPVGSQIMAGAPQRRPMLDQRLNEIAFAMLRCHVKRRHTVMIGCSSCALAASFKKRACQRKAA